jgi:hypothetical protein
MGIFGVLMGFTFSILIGMMTQTRDSQARALALQDMRLGVSQIDRQVRSGNVILDPSLETTGNAGVDYAGLPVGKFYSMRIFTQEGPRPRCAQWRVIDHDGNGLGNLEFRTWDPAWPAGDVTGWGVVAHNIDVSVQPLSQAAIDPSKPSTWPPFWVATPPAGASTQQAQDVRITLRLKAKGAKLSDSPASVTSVVTGRNTIFGYPSSSCSDVPPA